VIAALIGAALGILVIVVARAIRGERWVYAIGLLVLPGLYAFFASRIGEQFIGLKEMIYGIPFLAAGLIFAFVSVRKSALVVGSFWILHALYDLSHDQFVSNPGVPDWYPVFCFSVDVVVGVYLLWLSRRLPRGNLREE
jgi:hypothetical protein